MPAYLGWFFILLFCYGTALLTWAGLTQKSRGKYQSSRRYFMMAAFMALATLSFVIRRLTR